jgi:hypothetical protein
MPLIPVRGYSCDVIPRNGNNSMPVMNMGIKWNVGKDAYMLNPIGDSHWRLTGYLDVAPGNDDFFD